MTALMPDATAPAQAQCSHGENLFGCPACNDLCDVYDQPRWLCPHCPAFHVAVAAQKAEQPTAPDQPTRIAGAWVLRTDGRGQDWQRKWEAVDTGTGNQVDEETHVGLIRCGPKHLDDGQEGLCWMCEGMLRQLLADIPLLLHHLKVAIAGDHTFVEHGSHIAKVSEDSVALNWGERASKADKKLRKQLGRIAGACGVSFGTRRGVAPLFALRAIDQGLGQFVQRPDAAHLAAAFSDTVRAAHLAIDRPVDLIHYGKCPKCGKDIIQARATEPDDIIACTHADCGFVITLQRHQDKVIAQNEDRLLTVSELVAAISWAGVTVTRFQIHSWIRRDKLSERTVLGPPEFVDDVHGGGQVLTRKQLTGYPLREALSLAIEAQERANDTKGGRP